MRKLIVTLLCLGMAALAMPAAAQMQEFVSKDGRFSVLMPQPPKANIQPGLLTTHTFLAKLMNGTEYLGDYGVSYWDFTPAQMHQTPQQFLESLKGLEAAHGAKIIWDRPISLGKIPGRAVRSEDKRGYVNDMHCYVAGSRAYVVAVYAARDKIDQIDLKGFFNSFKIGP